MGGNEAFNHMMDSVFVIPSYLGIKSRGVIHEMREMQVMNMGQYAHGNQPIQHMVYLYNYSGEPWKAQYRVRDIMENSIPPLPTDIAVTKTTDKPRLGTYSRLSDSILSVPEPTNILSGHRYSRRQSCIWKREVPDHRGQKQQLGKQIYSFDKTQRKEPHAQLFQAQYLGRRRENTILHGQRTQFETRLNQRSCALFFLFGE